MMLVWAADAWEDYIYWQANDRKTLKRINTLIRDIQRQPYEGIGKPEPLRHNWTGYWSRRIDQAHRLAYKVRDDSIVIVQCRYH